MLLNKSVVKQRMQVYGSPYRSVLHCVRTVVRDEGVRAFYRSYTTQLSMNIPFQTLHFTVYEFTRETMNPTRGYDPKTHVVAGATAGAVAAALTTPLDVAKTLLNTQERGAVAIVGKPEGHAVYVSGMLTAFRSIYRLRGFSGYFQGLRARVLYQMPSCAICWSVYEFFKHFLHFAETEAEYELSPVWTVPTGRISDSCEISCKVSNTNPGHLPSQSTWQLCWVLQVGLSRNVVVDNM